MAESFIRLEGSMITFSFDPPESKPRRRRRRATSNGTIWTDAMRRRANQDKDFRRWERCGKPPAWDIESYTKL